MKIRKAAFLLILIWPLILSGQNINKNDFYEADMALVSLNYERAQKIFEKLLRTEPENANLNFLNGLCLMNLPGRKKESLIFLQKAAPKAYADYKYGSPQETNAPFEAIKYYGLASMANDDIPGALEQFRQYKSMLGSRDKDEIALTDGLIESCNNALKLKADPVFYKKTDLGENLKSDELKTYPVVNNNETFLFYTMKAQYNRDDIYFSQKKDGVWSLPVKITTQLGVKSECYASSVSYDDLRLYLTVRSGESTDIYCSEFSKDRWQKMVRLDKPINGSGWDSQAWESSDGRFLYFSSDRKGGFGNMDLYRSEKDEKGIWKKPVNLGDIINTEKNELMPALNPDQTKLFFKSEGHENTGGYDIFISELSANNEWSQPENIGYPVSTPDDDIYFIPVRDGNYAYIARENSEDIKKNDFWFIEIFSKSHPRKFAVSGYVLSQEDYSGIDNATIEVYNTAGYSKEITLRPDAQSGSFNFEIPGGSYKIDFISPDYKTYTQYIDLPLSYPEDALAVNAYMEKEKPVAEIIQEEPLKSAAVVSEETLAEKSISEEIYVEPEIAEQTLQYPVPSETKQKKNPVNESAGYTAGSDYAGKYTVQIMAALKKVDLTSLDGRYTVDIQKGEDGYYRYTTGVFNSIEEAEGTRAEIAKTRYKGAFVRRYNTDDYLYNAAIKTGTLYTIQLMAVKREVDITVFKEFPAIKASIGEDQYYRYTYGEFSTLNAAQKELKNVIGKGYPGAYIKKTVDVSNY
jgi:hypothetical protein